jgi:chromatin assembly factor 1 subunit A
LATVLSDKSLSQLSKHIHQELLPTLDEDDDNVDTSSLTHAALPLTLVENAIKAVLIRNNYGLDAPLGVKIPAAVCVWRWEVRSEHLDWLPRNSKEKAESRQTDRIQVSWTVS